MPTAWEGSVLETSTATTDSFEHSIVDVLNLPVLPDDLLAAQLVNLTIAQLQRGL